MPHERAEFQRRVIDRKRPAGLADSIRKLKDKLIADPPTVATRKASELALDVLVPEMPELLLGSADLTPSNNTRTKGLKEVTPEDFSGRYMHYGIREMGMAGCMNGLATHGGLAPAGGTFLCFTDYARGSMRISALSHAPVVYIMTHDSIGLGEDGPTHQPVEHLAALRAMPNMRVFRPADAVETAECWQLALEKHHRSHRFGALSRQNLTPSRTVAERRQSLQHHGGYELIAAKGEAKVSLYASGSEVRDCGRSPETARRARRRDPRGVGALARPAAGATGGRCERAIIGNGPGQDRDRSCGPVRLGCGDRAGRRIHRHARLRRQRPGEGPLPAFRHHRRGGGRMLRQRRLDLK